MGEWDIICWRFLRVRSLIPVPFLIVVVKLNVLPRVLVIAISSVVEFLQ